MTVHNNHLSYANDPTNIKVSHTSEYLING